MTSVTTARANSNANKRISNAIIAVQSARKERSAFYASKRLFELVSKSDLDNVDDKTIHELTSLLDTQYDGVRYWVASALACFGLRAKFAAPKLLEVLKESDCLISETSSSMPIRYALERMGVPPPEHTCEHYKYPS
jgi:hypothetical protein